MRLLYRGPSIHKLGILFLAVLLCLCAEVAAQTTYLNTDELPTSAAIAPEGVVQVGYEFQALQDTTVVSLGRTFVPTDTSLADTSVTLYDKSNQGILATTVYSSGENNFALTQPVQLQAGAFYVIAMGVLNNTEYPLFPFDSITTDAFNMEVAVMTQAVTGDSLEMPTTQTDLLQGLPNFFTQSDFTTAVDGSTATLAVNTVPTDSVVELSSATEIPETTLSTTAATDSTEVTTADATEDTTTSTDATVDSPVSTDSVETESASESAAEIPTTAATQSVETPTPEPSVLPSATPNPIVVEATTGTSDDEITGAGIAAVAITTVVCVGIVILSVVLYKWRHRYKSNNRRASDVSVLRINSNSGVYPQSPSSGYRAESGQYLGYRTESGQNLSGGDGSVTRNTQPV